MKLNFQNYKSGFLVNNKWLAGLLDSEAGDGSYEAYILSHLDNEIIFKKLFTNFEEACFVLESYANDWSFESIEGGCKGELCGPEKCKGNSCKKY